VLFQEEVPPTEIPGIGEVHGPLDLVLGSIICCIAGFSSIGLNIHSVDHELRGF
jgi:hypothetical protein